MILIYYRPLYFITAKIPWTSDTEGSMRESTSEHNHGFQRSPKTGACEAKRSRMSSLWRGLAGRHNQVNVSYQYRARKNVNLIYFRHCHGVSFFARRRPSGVWWAGSPAPSRRSNNASVNSRPRIEAPALSASGVIDSIKRQPGDPLAAHEL